MLQTIRCAIARANQLFDSACAVSVLLVSFTWLNIGRMPGGLDEFLAVRLTVRNVVLGALLIAIWHACFAIAGLYQTGVRETRRRRMLKIVQACTMGTICVSTFAFASSSGAFGLPVLAAFWAATIVVEILGREALALVAGFFETRISDTRRVVIVGSGPRATRLFDDVQARQPGHCDIVAFVDLPLSQAGSAAQPHRADPVDGFEALVSSRAVDLVMIALPVRSCYETIQRIVAICERVGVEAKYFPDIPALSRARWAVDDEDEMFGVRLQPVADDYRLIVKRAIDFACALCGLLLLLPLFAAAAIAIKLSSPGPVFFSQLRYGYHRRVFRMYKFRTMVQGAEALQGTLESLNEARGPIFKIREDPRVTRVGRIMRKLSIDELPQLFNVLNGDMSLVGPRPMSVRDVSRFNESWLMRRFSVKPGLTCLWQVNGRSNTDFDRWVELDLAYIDNWSLALDLRILLKTVPVVLSGTGAM